MFAQLSEPEVALCLSYLLTAETRTFAACSRACLAEMPHVTTLHAATVDADGLRRLQRWFPGAVELSVGRLACPPARALAFERLQTLRVRAARVSLPELRALCDAAAGGSSLRSLDLGGTFTWPAGAAGEALAQLRGPLEDLSLDGWLHATDAEVTALVAALSPGLRRLRVMNAHALRQVSLRSGSLRHAEFFSCPQLRAVEAGGCPGLRTLALCFTGVESAALTAVCAACGELEWLVVRGAMQLEALVLLAPRLRGLAVDLCGALTAVDVDAPRLATFRLDAGLAKGLQRVRVRSAALRRLSVFNAFVRTLELQAPALRELDVGMCKQLTYAELDCPRLQRADMARCPLPLEVLPAGCKRVVRVPEGVESLP